MIRLFLLSIYMLACASETKAMEWIKNWFATKKTQTSDFTQKEQKEFRKMQKKISEKPSEQSQNQNKEPLFFESIIIEELKEDEPETKPSTKPTLSEKIEKKLPNLPEKIAARNLIRSLTTLTEKLSTLNTTLSE